MHYDQYDNIFMQVAGTKHFLLFDPTAAAGLYPFPAAHPYDEYAMVHVGDRWVSPLGYAGGGRGVEA